MHMSMADGMQLAAYVTPSLFLFSYLPAPSILSLHVSFGPIALKLVVNVWYHPGLVREEGIQGPQFLLSKIGTDLPT